MYVTTRDGRELSRGESNRCSMDVEPIPNSKTACQPLHHQTQDPKQVIKNNTIEILMIYTHVFDNDILTFHYTTPFSNYESL